MAEPYETPPHMQDIYNKDKKRYSESDRLIEEGDLKGAAEVHPDKETLRNNLNADISGNNNIGGVVAGTTLEIGTGYAVDSATAPLLAFGPLGWLVYGLTNFSSGVASNYAAQKLRGVEEIGWGELLQSGLIDLVPYFGTQAKGAKSIANVALQSGARTIAGEQLRVGIDEGRALTPSEVAVSGTLGTAIGGTIKATPEVIELGNKLKQQIAGMNPGEFAATTGTGFWDLATSRSNKYGNRRYWTNLSGANQKLFRQAGLTDDDAIFLLSNWEGPVPRNVAAAIEDPYFSEGTFEFMKGELLPEILKGLEGVEGLNKIEIDHVAQLRAILPFYNNRKVKQFPRIRAILQEEGVFGGHNPKNLKGLPSDIHTIKSRFWTKHVGQDGSKFFAGRKLRTYEQVRTAAKDMNELMERSNKIVESVSAQYKFLNKKDITSGELIQILEKFDLNHGDYNLKEINDILRDVVPEIDAVLAAQEIAKTVPKIDVLKLAQQWQEVDPIKFEALMFKIQGATTKQVKRRFPGLSAKQLSIFEQITPQQYQMLQNRYGLSGKQGIFSKPVDPP